LHLPGSRAEYRDRSFCSRAAEAAPTVGCGAGTSQKRAELTRRRLLQAAAIQFASDGYAGTSLVRISHAAGVTMGALAFHFPSKIDLVRAICVNGAAATRTAVALVDGPDKPPLQSVIDITHALAALLREDPVVRAAGRLSWEPLPLENDWAESWLPRVRELLEQAGRENLLRPNIEPELVTLLVRYLVSGLETSAHDDGDRPAHLRRLEAIWQVVLPGITDLPERLSAGGTV
jgi:AcrR family transcriptional regulator